MSHKINLWDGKQGNFPRGALCKLRKGAYFCVPFNHASHGSNPIEAKEQEGQIKVERSENYPQEPEFQAGHPQG